MKLELVKLGTASVETKAKGNTLPVDSTQVRIFP